MTKIYKVLVNDGKAESNAVQVTQGAGDKDATVRLVAQRGVRYELQDVSKGKGFAPDQVRAKRVGSNLALMLDGSEKPDVEIEDYYVVQGEGSAPVLAGLAENGSVYEYIPQDPNANHLTPSLKDGHTPVLMALGGGALGEAFVLSGLPVVAAAAGGISGWAIAAGVVGAAALGGGGGGGGGASKDTTPPAAATGKLKHDAVNDTGVSTEDNITNNKQPVLLINAESGAKVEVLIGTKTYVATETSTKGVYEVKITDDLVDGSYTPKVTVTDPAGNKNTDGKLDTFTVDSSFLNNLANGEDIDLNNGSDTRVSISAVSEDTGTVTNDFITSARNVKMSGTVSQFHDTGISAGASVLVQIFDASNPAKLVEQEYVHPDANGAWTMTTPTAALVDGAYTVKAAIVDAAGNVVKTAPDQTLVISQTYFSAVNDAVTVQEDQLAVFDTEKNNVLLNDSDVNNLRSEVTSVQFGAATVTVTQNTTYAVQPAVLKGKYGSLSIGADGSYLYNLDNSNTNIYNNVIQSLSISDQLTETFHYTAVNSKGLSSGADLIIKIQGVNDAAAVLSYTPLSVTMRDVDNGEQEFNLTPSQMHYQGTNGYYVFESNVVTSSVPTIFVGTVKYFLNVDATLQANVRESHDLFTLTSKDGTAFETFDQSIKSTDATRTIFQYNGVNGHDDVWMPTGQSIDLTDPSKYLLNSIEKIDLTSTGNNTIKLSLASLMQADVDATSHVKQLTINRDSGDVVEFKLDAGAAAPTAELINGYDVYHLTNANQSATYDLLVQHTTNAVTFS